MRTNIITVGLAFLISTLSFSQSENSDVLFTVNGSSIPAEEFVRVYNKNLNLVKDEQQKDIDEYLKLFINYKLKLTEARALNFDKKPAYINELRGYKKQLAKNYLTDKEVTDALIKEAYDRMQYDVKAQHILIRMDASQEDTITAYNKLLSLRDRFKNENFSAVKKQVHNGNTILVEDLGYFSGFKMVYDFETAAFNTKVGEVSLPFRTQFGYHIVKVLDKRKSRGEVTVGHIMIANQQQDTTIDPKARIHEINDLLKEGQAFEALAKQFSEDKSSARKGGKLAAFKAGQLSSAAFEDIAFGLSEENPISKPFQTEFGWHIVKLYKKKSIGAFEEERYQLENQISRDSRSRLINTSMVEKLKTKYNVPSSLTDKAYFVSILTPDFYKRTWQAPKLFDKTKNLIKIGTKQFTYGDFMPFLRAQQKTTKNGTPYTKIVDKAYEAFLNRSIMKYHEANLEFVNKEFAHILNEYREGLLLFDLMETKIWNAVKEDTLGIKNYYESHKQEYKAPSQINAVIATTTAKSDAKSVKRLLENKMNLYDIKKELAKNPKQKVVFTTGKMTLDHQSLPKDFEAKEGVSKLYHHNDAYHVIFVKEFIPEQIKPFEEARGMVISDFQEEVEKNWLVELQNKYPVKINQNVLNKVKAQIQN